MKPAQTSDRVSSIAAKYAGITSESLKARMSFPEETAADIRTMAASLLRQDEYRGLRGLVRKVLGG